MTFQYQTNGGFTFLLRPFRTKGQYSGEHIRKVSVRTVAAYMVHVHSVLMASLGGKRFG